MLMADTLFIVSIQIWVYRMVYTFATRVWLADRALLLAGLMIQAVTVRMTGPMVANLRQLAGTERRIGEEIRNAVRAELEEQRQR